MPGLYPFSASFKHNGSLPCFPFFSVTFLSTINILLPFYHPSV